MNSKQMGDNAESRFLRICSANSLPVTKSNEQQDKFEHWDFLVDGKRVEVKSRKKAKRSDDNVDDSIVYVEFRNVKGDIGWLYGQADLIAFERPEGFALVSRTKLKTLSETLVGDNWATRPTLYKRYHRRDRPDECVGLIKYADLIQLPYLILKEDKSND